MIPEPVTPPERDTGRRVQSAYDLEVTLVGFLTRLFSGQRLDNPTLNLAQATAPEPRIVHDPDEPPVSYDPAARAQTLALKVAPRVVRGRVPRTVTGEIAVDKLPDVPNIIVQAIKAKVEQPSTIVTVRILFSTYDENPDSQGYQDCLNLIETAAQALTSFGQQAIDQAYPIQLPLEWTLIEPDCFPHFVGEMTTTWELPSARPLPDDVAFDIVPGEDLDYKLHLLDAQPPKPPRELATKLFLLGPATGGASGAPSAPFTVALPEGSALHVPVVVTPDDGGAGGIFKPQSVVLSTGLPSKTFTYTPVPADADTFLMFGPDGGNLDVASEPFTVSLPVGTTVHTPVTITPNDGGAGGTFDPPQIVLSADMPSAKFTYTPHV
jgi:hypothetical protein